MVTILMLLRSGPRHRNETTDDQGGDFPRLHEATFTGSPRVVFYEFLGHRSRKPILPSPSVSRFSGSHRVGSLWRKASAARWRRLGGFKRDLERIKLRRPPGERSIEPFNVGMQALGVCVALSRRELRVSHPALERRGV